MRLDANLLFTQCICLQFSETGMQWMQHVRKAIAGHPRWMHSVPFRCIRLHTGASPVHPPCIPVCVQFVLLPA